MVLSPVFFSPIGAEIRINYGTIAVDVGNDTFQFTCVTRHISYWYKMALRFCRMVERGYEPTRAYHLARYEGECPTLKNFERNFDPASHDKLSDERVDVTLVDCPDMMFTDPLTPADKERLFALWLEDGDEIFHFDPELSLLWDIPAMLSDFRALAQSEDDPRGDWSHPHHLDLVTY